MSEFINFHPYITLLIVLATLTTIDNIWGNCLKYCEKKDRKHE